MSPYFRRPGATNVLLFSAPIFGRYWLGMAVSWVKKAESVRLDHFPAPPLPSSLLPTNGLGTRIDSSVRKDRRCFWAASIAIQTRWRMLPKRAFYRLLKQEVKRVQTHFRMWSDRRVYVFFKRQVLWVFRWSAALISMFVSSFVRRKWLPVSVPFVPFARENPFWLADSPSQPGCP